MDYKKFAFIRNELVGQDRRLVASLVRVAASLCYSIWADYEKVHFQSDHGGRLLQTFDSWLCGKASKEELQSCFTKLHELLPKDLSAETNLSYGLAGWAIADVAILAVEDCEDVFDSILETSLLYAAASVCGTGEDLIALKPIVLTSCEEAFLSRWWSLCQNHSDFY